jgi:hypothetical protein
VLRPSALLAMLALALPSIASGAAFEIDSRTEAQVYEIRNWQGCSDPSCMQLLPRRRLVQYLGVNAYELIPNAPLGFESSLRVFADFGLPQGQAAKIDGTRSEDADLLFANVYYHGRDVDFRIGRQIYTDMTGTMAFDGAFVRYTHSVGPLRIGAEAYAGLWVKAGAVLGSSVYQPDGIRESDLRRVGLNLAPPYAALDDIEPIVGANLVMLNSYGMTVHAGFKQGWLGGATDVRRLDADLKWTGFKGLTVLVGIDYDLLLMRIANARWSGRVDLNMFSVVLEYLRISPLLSADSIFYYFANAPRDGGRLRVEFYPSGYFRFYAQGLVDVYGTPLNPISTMNPTGTVVGAFFYPQTTGATAGQLPQSYSLGGSVGATMRAGSFRALADATFKSGYGGSQVWLDLNGGYVPAGSKVTAEARLSVANVSDTFNPLLNGTYVGFQVWGSYLLTRASRFSLVVEQNFGPATKSDTKLFVLYDLKAVL